MTEVELDDVDRAILYVLQLDSRNNTNAAISDQIDVSASTVGKRIKRMEESGVINGYRPEIDYELAQLPLEVLFICTAPITDREMLIEKTREIEGVTNIRELMTGRGNVHIKVVGSSNDDITRIAREIDGLGYEVTDEILSRGEYTVPLTIFRKG